MSGFDDTHEGDVILFEQIDRLVRLNQTYWDTLKKILSDRRLSVVPKELLTSYKAL